MKSRDQSGSQYLDVWQNSELFLNYHYTRLSKLNVQNLSLTNFLGNFLKLILSDWPNKGHQAKKNL